MTVLGSRVEEMRQCYEGPIFDVVQDVVRESGLEDSSLSEMLRYQWETGGKRLRAVLPLLVAETLGEDPSKMVAFGAACEMIHNATLIYDDLQDGDKSRRGMPAIWVRFGCERAINLGNALLYMAPLCLNRLQVSAERRWAVANRIFRDVLQVIDGQQKEFDLKGIQAERKTYEEMVVGKTSGLFALPMAGAAQLCGAQEQVVHLLEESARHLGVIFQIQDDIVDLYGEKGRGSRGADIREGKISVLVVEFSQVASESEVRRLYEILGTPREKTSEDAVAWAIESIRERGALDKALQYIEEKRREVLSREYWSAHLQLRNLVKGLIDVFIEPIRGV